MEYLYNLFLLRWGLEIEPSVNQSHKPNKRTPVPQTLPKVCMFQRRNSMTVLH